MRKLFAHLLFLTLLSACSYLPSPADGTRLPPTQPQVTITSIVIRPTPSVTPPALPAHTNTPPATQTQPYLPTQTSALLPSPTWTPSSTVEAKEAMPYAVQSGSPVYTASFHQPDQGCRWMGIAGQVFGAGMAPEKNLIVFASGQMNGSPVNALGITGQTPAYGDGGYEIQLSNAPIASSGTITVQLFDLSIKPLSKPVVLSTSGDCAKSLILLNFQSGGAQTYSVAP